MSMAAGARAGARLLQLRSSTPFLRGHLPSSAAVVPSNVTPSRGFAADHGHGPARVKEDPLSPSKRKEEQVPIPMYGVTGKYASALFLTAVRGSVLDPVEKELKDIINAAHQNEVFGEFLKDPSVSKDTRMKAVQEVFGKESGYSDVTKNFLAVLAENGRLKEIFKISTAYSELVLAHKGEVNATVTSALELSQEELLGIKESLTGYLKPGQKLQIVQKVDRNIIGGIVIDILDKHIDLSVDTRIKQMEKVLAENF